jgi:2-oxoisovalerate dehydrogenase E1 component alpha subunit
MQRDRPDVAGERPGADASLTDEQFLAVYKRMVLCRTLDERVWMLNRQGKAAIVASAQGHEAAQMGSVWALKRGTDRFYLYYRDLAVLVALGMTPTEIMLGFVAKEGEPLSGARQFPVHGAHADLGIVNLSNVVGTQIPQAVGSAMASRMRGEDAVTICYFGDGAASTGDCHEGMNFAAVHKLPIIFLCENNRYAISVPLSKQMAVDSVASRAEGYGMPGVVVDGTDVVSVYEATSEAAARARAGQGPTIVETMVERYLPHTSDDDDSRYRLREDIDEARKRDPVKILGQKLVSLGVLDPTTDERFHSEGRRAVDEATELTDQASYPGTDGFFDHVYAGGPPSR